MGDLLDVVIITHWKDGSLEIAHLTTRNSENASASGGKPLTPSPPHVTNNGKHVQIIKILGGKNIKLGWGIYTPGGNFQNYVESPKPKVGLVILMVIKCFLSNL